MKRRIISIVILAFLIILLNLLFLSENIAEFFSVSISRYINVGLGAATSLVNFSIAEWVFLGLALSLVLGLIALVFRLITLRFFKVKKSISRFIIAVLSIVLVINLTITSGYSRKTIDEPLNLSVETLDETKIEDAARYYYSKLTALNNEVARDKDGNVAAVDFKEINDLLNAEFEKLDNKYFTGYNFKAKPVTLSKLMTYFSISGIYFPLTGEANISTICPNYQMPIIMAHELSHARGVMREDEANFLAYYICINSDNFYLQYCGYMLAFTVMINNFAINKEASAQELYNSLPEQIRTEFKNALEFYDKYDSKFLTSVSEFFNNLWLKSNKVKEGTASYSKTAARLYVLYKKNN